MFDTNMVGWHGIHKETAEIFIQKSFTANFLMQYMQKMRNLGSQTSSAFFSKCPFFGSLKAKISGGLA